MEHLKSKVKSCYIHIPFCKKICSYCDFCKIYKSTNYAPIYLNALEKEINDNYKGEILDTIYVGGGTPSCLNDCELDILFNTISKLRVSNDLEFTFECNVEDITDKLMSYLKIKGVNRLSIGVESFNKKLLKILNRRDDIDIVKKVNIAKKYFDNINIDIIYAIKGETLKDLNKDLDTVLKLDIKHISAYSLILEKHTMLYNKGVTSIREDMDYLMYKIICDRLKNYNHYEISNFCLDGYSSRHNLTYWNNFEYYGFGLSASGYINNVRYENTRSITKYINGNYLLNKRKLSFNEEVENAIILGFRKLDGINLKDFYNRYKFRLEKIEIVEQLVKENKLVIYEYNIKINDKYIYISNDILYLFLGINYEIEKKQNK